MGLKEEIGFLAYCGISAVTAATTMFLTLVGTNQLINRTYYESRDKESIYVSITKPDLFGTTSLTHIKNKNYIQDRVHKYNWFSSSVFYTDGGWHGKHDGLVDTIEKVDGLDIEREKDLDRVDKINNKIVEYKEEFKKADKILAETKERFKEYLK